MQTAPDFHERHGEPLLELLCACWLWLLIVAMSGCSGLKKEVHALRIEVQKAATASIATRQYTQRLDSAWTRQSQERIDFERNENKSKTDTAGAATLRRMGQELLRQPR